MLIRFPRLIAGLLLYGIADAFMMRAGLGVSPWLVFSQGLSQATGIGIGLLTNIIGLIVLLAAASGIYIGTHLGAGPRDGLMTGIHSRFGTPLWVGRTAVEATVLIIGWILGGDAWIGTIAFALLIGPLCGLALPIFDPDLRRTVKTPQPRPGTGGAVAGDPDPDHPEGMSEGATPRPQGSC